MRLNFKQMVIACLLSLVILSMPVWKATPTNAAPAPESPLAQVPASAPIVVHLRGYERTKDRLASMLKNALPDVGALAQAKLDEAIKEALKDRELKGLSRDGSLFLVFMEMPKGGKGVPRLAILAFAAQYATFRDSILLPDERKALKKDSMGIESTTVNGHETHFLNRGSYVVITPHKDVAELFAKQQPGLDGKLSADMARRLLEADLAACVDMEAINKTFGDDIKRAKVELEKSFKEASNEIGGLNKSTAEAAKLLLDPLFQAVTDSKTFLLTAEFRPTGLALHTQVEPNPRSKTSAALKGFKPMAQPDVVKLPDGQTFYFAMQNSPALLESLGSFTSGIVTNHKGKQKEVIEASLKEMAEAGPRAAYSSTGFPLQALQVSLYDKPAKAVAAQLRMMEALEGGDFFSSGVLKGKAVIKKNAQKHRDFDLHHVNVTWDFDKIGEQFGGQGMPEAVKKQMADAMKKILGENLNMWFGTDGKLVLQATANDWQGAQKLLDNYLDNKATVSQNKNFTETLKQLPAEATVYVYMDAPKYFQLILETFLTALQGLLPQNPALAAKPKPSYMGIAVTLQPERVSADVWVPGTTADEIYKIIDPLMKQMGGGF